MKKLLLLATLVLGLTACGKQQTDAERQAEIDRQVRQRLETEHQADAQRTLDQRQADLDARERALSAQDNQPAATATAVPARESASDTADEGSYATFYRKLDPYGAWFETSTYGYVFQPRQAAQAGKNWRPYTNGHWVYTDAGWTWISDEPFGWATYHYGRWVRLRSTGWVWVPGEEWAPAWVSWRRGNDFVGWAPLPPEARFDRQTGIHNWADNYYDIGPEQYAFVPANEFGGAQSARVVVPAERNVTIINQTSNVTNITYQNSTVIDRGPSYDDLKARSQHQIPRLRLERTQNFDHERTVLRGEVVAIPVRDFRPADRAARPPRVQRTINQPTVERGWEGIRDSRAAQQARAKMEAEATPPANLPPKKDLRRPLAPPAPSTPPAATTTPPRRANTRPPASAAPRPTAIPAPSAAQATATATPTATPTATATATLNPQQQKRRERMLDHRKQKRQERNAAKRAEENATASPASSPAASASPALSPSPSETPLREKSSRRPGPKPNQP